MNNCQPCTFRLVEATLELSCHSSLVVWCSPILSSLILRWLLNTNNEQVVIGTRWDIVWYFSCS